MFLTFVFLLTRKQNNKYRQGAGTCRPRILVLEQLLQISDLQRSISFAVTCVNNVFEHPGKYSFYRYSQFLGCFKGTKAAVKGKKNSVV